MEPSDAIIRVRSEKQAMDWSLVLISQGIESALERTPEDGAWLLAVSPADLDRAWASIRQYERENRRRRWQQPVRGTGLLFDWRAVFCLLPLAPIYFVTAAHDLLGKDSPVIMDNHAVWHGEWWRLFTSMTLHADPGHLANNLVTGILLLGLAMGSYGAGKALLGSYLSGVMGNLTGLFLLDDTHRSLGASGLVLGALGLLTVQSLSLWRAGESHRRLISRALVGGLLLLVLLGLNPQADVLAHVGGFAGGCLLGTVLVFLPEKWTRAALVDHAAGFICLALVLLTWGRALA